jgi:hypothetical protein
MNMALPLKVGTRIAKTNSEPADLHQDGAQGVLLEVLPYSDSEGFWGYVVEWDDKPGSLGLVASNRAQPVFTPNESRESALRC